MIPKEIRKVEGPKNTIVIDHGGNGIKRYAVIQRIGCKRIGGKNIPINDPTIGYIHGGQFYECKVETVSHATCDVVDYADAVMVELPKTEEQPPKKRERPRKTGV